MGEPVLRLSVQGPESVEVGEEVLWKVLVTNDGNAAARHVQIRSVLPSGFQVSGSASEQVSRLLPGQSAQLTVKAVPGEAGIFSAFFSAGYDVASGPAKVVQGNAQIQVRSSQVRMVVTGPATRYIFAPATYTLNVTNTGGTALENLTLVNDLPKGAVLYGKVSEGGEVFSRRSETSAPQLLEARTDAKTGVSGYWQQDGNPLRDDSAGQVQWAIASLEPGQSVSREVTYYSALPGSPENLARVVTSRGLSANSSFTTQWKAIPGLYTALVDDADPIKVGDKLTYTVTVGNQSHDGTILVRSLEVTVPSVLKVESAGEGGRVNGNVVTFQQVELAPQQKVELTITAIGEKLGTGIAVMKTTTNFHAEPIINEQSTSVY